MLVIFELVSSSFPLGGRVLPNSNLTPMSRQRPRPLETQLRFVRLLVGTRVGEVIEPQKNFLSESGILEKRSPTLLVDSRMFLCLSVAMDRRLSLDLDLVFVVILHGPLSLTLPLACDNSGIFHLFVDSTSC